MSTRTPSLALAVMGAIVFTLSLTANSLGVGSNPRAFGWIQSLGVALGALMLIAGIGLIWFGLRPYRRKK